MTTLVRALTLKKMKTCAMSVIRATTASPPTPTPTRAARRTQSLARASSSWSNENDETKTTMVMSRGSSGSEKRDRIFNAATGIAVASAPTSFAADERFAAASSSASGSGDPIAGAAFAIAVVLLVIITGGMGYIALREALDRNEEKLAREEEERKIRVVEANRGRFGDKASSKSRLTPSQRAAKEIGDEGSPSENRRERRKREREERR